MTHRICFECDHRWNGGLICPECGGPGEPLPPPAVWPDRVVFSTNKSSDNASRSRYRLGRVSPTLATVQRWCEEQGLRFTVDANGVWCERVSTLASPGRSSRSLSQD